MIGYKTVAVSSQAEVLMGQSPPSSACTETGEGVPFIQGNAEFGVRYPVPRLKCSSPTRLAEAGDLLLSVRAPVGELNQAIDQTVIGRGLSALRFHPRDQQYAWHAVKWSAGALNRVAQGSTFVAVSRQDVEKLEIPWHSDANERIASVLDTIDSAIAKAESIIAKLKQVRVGMLHDLLTRGLDEAGQLRNPGTHPEQFKESPLGMVPKNWEVVECQNLCREIVVGIVVKPAQYYCDDGIPVLRSANVREEGIQLSNLVYISSESNLQLSKSMLHTGDVVTVRTGYPGTTSVVPESLNGSNCVDIIISRPGNKILPRFLACWINSPFGKDQVLRVQGGLAQQHFNVGEMKTLLVAKPELIEQEMIIDHLDRVDAMIRCEIDSLSKLVVMKSGLADDLLTGAVPVPEDLFR